MVNILSEAAVQLELPPRSDAAIPPIGEVISIPVIDGYRLSGPLGHGGMGTVWRAWQISTRREVALKLLATSALGSDKARHRFEREVELTGKLNHSGIARIYDSGIHQNIYYYAMELVDGVHLDAYVRERKLSVREILGVMLKVCVAVQHAHQRGVIHRDLKPSNILVDAAGEPRILDFGLAKLPELSRESALISLDGDLAGTPAFMSPEQATGHMDQIDTRTDVYSLGVVLYLLLTDTYPIDISGSSTDILQRVINDDVKPFRKCGKKIDHELQTLLMKALAKEPDERYSNAGALGDDIAKYLRNDPISARPQTVTYFLKKKLRKHRWTASIAAILTIFLITVLANSSQEIARQRNTALASAKKENMEHKAADIARNEAESRLQEISLLWANDLTRQNNWQEAKSIFANARAIGIKSHLSTFASETGLLECFIHSPDSLAEISSQSTPIVAAHYDATQNAVLIFTRNNCFASCALPSQQLASFSPRFGVTGKQCLFCPSAGIAIARVNADDGTHASMIIHDLKNAKPDKEFHLRGPIAGPLAVSANEKTVITICGLASGADKPGLAMILCDLTGKEQIRTLPIDAPNLNAIAISPDGKAVVTGCNDGQIEVWDLPSGGLHIKSAVQSFEAITTLLCLPDNKTAIEGRHDGALETLDLAQAKATQIFLEKGPEITSLAYFTRSDILASGDKSGSIKLWHTNGTMIGELRAHTAAVTSLEFSNDGAILSSASEDGTAKFWPVISSGTFPRTLNFAHKTTAMAVTADNKMGLFGQFNGSVELIDLATGQKLQTFQAMGEPVYSVAFVAGTQTIAATYWDGTLRTWDMKTGRIIACGFPNQQYAKDFDLFPDGRSGLCVGMSGAILRDTANNFSHDLLRQHPMDIGGQSANGERAFAMDANGFVFVFALPVGNLFNTFQVRDQSARCAALSSNGELGLFGFRDGILKMIDMREGIELWTVVAQDGDIRTVHFCDHDRLAITTADDGKMRLWDIAGKRRVRDVACDDKPVVWATLSPDEKMIMVTDKDGTNVRVWDLAAAGYCADHEAEVAAARLKLRADPKNGPACMELARWSECFGNDEWAQYWYEAAQAAGTNPEPMQLASCYWRLGDLEHARQKFELARKAETSNAPYFDLCVSAIQNAQQIGKAVGHAPNQEASVYAH